jgi:hypothetical protein
MITPSIVINKSKYTIKFERSQVMTYLSKQLYVLVIDIEQE